MKDSLFRDYDNNNKYVKAPYQGATAKIGHIEYLYDYLKENLLSDWTLSDEGYSVGVVVFDTDGLYRNDIEGNTTQPSVNSPANGWTLISGIGTSSYEPPYKVYTAILNQSGVANEAPTAVVLENTLGAPVEHIYDGVGSYYARCTGKFTVNKTVIFTGQNYDNTGKEITYAYPINIDDCYIETKDNGVAYDGSLINTFIEIRVYN